MERDGNDVAVQYYRWSLLAQLCERAASVAQAALVHKGKIDSEKAFEIAMLELLGSSEYSKNDLVAISSMLLLGAHSLHKICQQTSGFLLTTNPQQDDGARP